MRNAQRLHDERSDHLGSTRSVGAGFDVPTRSSERAFIVAVERGSQRPGERSGLRRVIPVVVGDEEPEGRPGHYELRAELSHPLGGAGWTDPGIHKHALALRFDDQAVAARSGAEHEDTHARAIVVEGRAFVEPKPADDWRSAPPVVL